VSSEFQGNRRNSQRGARTDHRTDRPYSISVQFSERVFHQELSYNSVSHIYNGLKKGVLKHQIREITCCTYLGAVMGVAMQAQLAYLMTQLTFFSGVTEYA